MVRNAGFHPLSGYGNPLRKANGSRTEAETQLILSTDLSYLQPEQLSSRIEDTGLLGKKLLALERSLALGAGASGTVSGR